MSGLSHVTCLLFLVSCLTGEPAAAPLKSSTERGEKLLEAYFRRETQRLADACLTDIKTKEDWLHRRPELRQQFLEMLGLWPLPPRTALNAVVTGKINTERFILEKLHFQSVPGLY